MRNSVVSMGNFVARFHKNEKGTQLVETAVWLAIITTAAITAITAIGPSVATVMGRISGAIT